MKSMLDRDLEILHKEILQMGALCEEAIQTAIKALKTNDKTLAKRTIDIEQLTNKKERDIEDLCLKSLLRQQPVAKDLRKISSILKMITDMERIGDQARDIAEISLVIDLSHTIDTLSKIADAATKMVTDSIDCYVSNDLVACQKVLSDDNNVDELFHEIQSEIADFVFADKKRTLEGMYVLMAAKYFERIADHATNIVEWVEFTITGKHKGVDLF